MRGWRGNRWAGRWRGDGSCRGGACGGWRGGDRRGHWRRGGHDRLVEQGRGTDLVLVQRGRAYLVLVQGCRPYRLPGRCGLPGRGRRSARANRIVVGMCGGSSVQVRPGAVGPLPAGGRGVGPIPAGRVRPVALRCRGDRLDPSGGGDGWGVLRCRGDRKVGHHRQVRSIGLRWLAVGRGRDGSVEVGPLRGRSVGREPFGGRCVGPEIVAPRSVGRGRGRPLVLAVVPAGVRPQRSRLGPGQAAARRPGERLWLPCRRLGPGVPGRPVGVSPLVARLATRRVVDVTVRVRGTVRVPDAELRPVPVHPEAIVVRGLAGVAAPLVAGALLGTVAGVPAARGLGRSLRGGGPTPLLARLRQPTGLRPAGLAWPAGRDRRATVPVLVAVGRFGSARPLGVAVGLALVSSVGVAAEVALGFTMAGPLRVAVGLASVGVALRVAVGLASVAAGRGAGRRARRADVGPGDSVAPTGRLGLREVPAVGPLRPCGGVRPVVRAGTVRPLVTSLFGYLVPARPAVRLVGPGPAHVRAVGSGRRERWHLGPSDGARPAPRRRRLMVVDADVAWVTLARELWLPFARRLADPGRLAGIVPPVGVAATHPADLSVRSRGRCSARQVAAGRPLTAAPRWSARVRSLTAMSPRRKWSCWAPPGTGEVARSGTEWLRKEGSGVDSLTATAARCRSQTLSY